MINYLSPAECANILEAVKKIWQEAIWSHLPRKFRERVLPPTFALNDEMKPWGRWHGGDKRLMELKTQLILEHPWYAVVDVVLHETAHQLVEIFCPHCDEPPHGERFKWYCRLLGANPQASNDFPPLDAQVFLDDSASEESPMVLKIRKLLALSGSSNENEARLALMKARELMARHDLEYLEHGQGPQAPSHFVSITVGTPLEHITQEYFYLANILKDFYNVDIIWISVPTGWDPMDWRHALEISGTPLDVRIASYAYDFLVNYLDMAWEQQAAILRLRNSARNKRDFAIGVFSAFHDALMSQNHSPELSALVKVEHPELDAYYARRYPRIRKMHSSIKINQTAQDAGAKLGRKLRVPQGLENSPVDKLKLSGGSRNG